MMKEGVLIIGTAGDIFFANKAYLDFIRLTAEESIGRHLRGLRPHAQMPSVVTSDKAAARFAGEKDPPAGRHTGEFGKCANPVRFQRRSGMQCRRRALPQRPLLSPERLYGAGSSPCADAAQTSQSSCRISFLCEDDTITAAALPDSVRRALADEQKETLAERVYAFEQAEIRTMLYRYGNTLEGKRKATAALGISLASLYNKLK